MLPWSSSDSMAELPNDEWLSTSICGYTKTPSADSSAFAVVSAGLTGTYGEVTLSFMQGSRVFLEAELSPFSVEF
jgi:hypothetical protein